MKQSLTPKKLKMLNPLHILTSLLILFLSCSCGNRNSSEQEKIKKMENEIEQLKRDNESGNKQSIKDDNNSMSKSNDEYTNTKSISYYIFAKFHIRYTAMSGVNQTKEYVDVGITNIFNLKDYSEEVKYKIKDLIKSQNILLTAPFNSNQKIVNIEVFSFYDYVTASKEREKIDYKYQISLSAPF